METRFWLRFETGERGGERVPIPAEGLTVGRLADNGLVLSSASVSGNHAKLSVADEDVVLRDLGSTNGTRVGTERIESRLLRHGDTLRFGNVVVTFLDGCEAGASPAPAAQRPPDRAAPAPAPRHDAEQDELVLEGFDELDGDAPDAAPDLARTVLAQEATHSPAAAGEAVGRIAADRLARSAPRSAVGGLVLLLLAAGATALILWRRGAGGARAQRDAPVAVDPANLLGEGFSFEGERAGWVTVEGAPAAFDRGSAWRASGRQGFGVHLAPGAWAEAASNELIAPAIASGRGGLSLSAAASADGAAALRIGLELRRSRGRAQVLVAWSEPLQGGRGALELAVGPVPGCDRARVLVQAFDASGVAPRTGAPGVASDDAANAGADGAEPTGSAGIDDVVLRARDQPVEPVRFEEYELHRLGAGAAALARIDRVLAWDLGFEAAAAAGERFAARAPEIASVPGAGFELRPRSDSAAGNFSFRVEGELAGAGVATLGAGGRRAHPISFEASDVEEVLVGSGLDLLRFRLGAPCRVVGREQEGALLVACSGDLEAVVLQVAFRDERARALRLADRARGAERAGDLGACLAHWAELLDTLPFDAPLVEEATSARARLVQAGLERAQALRVETERARFFALADLHREVRAEARALAERYRGSEVEEAVTALVAEIDAELDRLEAGRCEQAAEVLIRVARALEERGAPALARHVRAESGLAAAAAPLPGSTPPASTKDGTTSDGTESDGTTPGRAGEER